MHRLARTCLGQYRQAQTCMDMHSCSSHFLFRLTFESKRHLASGLWPLDCEIIIRWAPKVTPKVASACGVEFNIPVSYRGAVVVGDFGFIRLFLALVAISTFIHWIRIRVGSYSWPAVGKEPPVLLHYWNGCWNKSRLYILIRQAGQDLFRVSCFVFLFRFGFHRPDQLRRSLHLVGQMSAPVARGHQSHFH